MLAATGAAAVFAQSLSLLADDVPTFDIQKACKTDIEAYEGSYQGGRPKGCLNDEQNARAKLESQWTQYAAKSKAECLKIQRDGSVLPSYVELLTCLEMTMWEAQDKAKAEKSKR